MSIRGFEWMIYTDDQGARWLMQVDADYAADPDRGWAERTEDDVLQWPQGWKPREVVGVEAGGNLQRARVGHLLAPLWTREVSTFAVNASDALPVAAAVIRYLSERKRPAAPPLP